MSTKPKSFAVRGFTPRTLLLLFSIAFPIAVSLACLSLPKDAAARDDVPEEIAATPNPVTLEESDVRYYQRQFKGKCARCHGLDGAGNGSAAAANAVPPRDFTNARYMSTRTDGQLFYQILMGGGKRCAMPAFGPESDVAWSEDKIWHMVAYIRRFAQEPTP